MFKVNEIVRACSGKLIQGDPGAKISAISTDSREKIAQKGFLALRGKNFDGHDYLAQAARGRASCLIIEIPPKIAIPKHLAVIKVKDTLLALGDLARFKRQKIDPPVIAVTGSNGKTTTKEMVAWVLGARGQVLKNEGTKNNQVGLPQTLLRLCPQDKFAVVEIGTNHFGEVDYLAKIAIPDIGIITNIGPSHLEFLKDLKGVAKEKSALLDNLAGPAITLLNGDDPLLQDLIRVKGKAKPVFSYGLGKGSDFCASQVKLKGAKVRFKVNAKHDFELSTLGVYNIYNALPAIAVGRIFGLSYRQIRARLSGFEFPKGRFNLVEHKGLRFIDDTYNANPLSLSVALEALKKADCRGRKILILGDMLELGRQKELLHRRMAWGITNTCDLLIAVGGLARITARQARIEGLAAGQVFCCTSAQDARNLLFKKINPGRNDLILVKGSRSMKMETVLGV